MSGDDLVTGDHLVPGDHLVSRCRWTRTGPAGDAGFTLVEVMMAMSIMATVMAMATAGILQMYRVTNRDLTVTNAQNQLNVIFLRLDRAVRYAAGLSAPATVSGDPYVEYLTTNTGTAVCTELRLHTSTGQLQSRTWVQGVTPLSPGPWTTLGTSLSGATPFTVLAADSSFNYQRLELNVTASYGTGTVTTRRTDVTFPALNTSLSTSSPTVCVEGRAIP